MSGPPVKKLVLWLIVIFLIYAILQSPHEAASIIGTIWDVIYTGVKNIFVFFQDLLHR